MKRAVFVSILLFVMHVAADGAEMRTWTSKKGDTVRASYIRMFGDKVMLKTADGRQLKVPVEGLSGKDQKYLASMVPPKLDIDVDIDSDVDTEYSSDYYMAKRETVKCIVTVKKTNKEPCDRDFRVGIYLLAEEEGGSDLWLVSKARDSLSFADGGRIKSFSCPAANIRFRDSYSSGKRGFRYEGYLVIVEDSEERLIAVESDQGSFEKNWRAIKDAAKNARLDKDFDNIGTVSQSSRNYYYY